MKNVKEMMTKVKEFAKGKFGKIAVTTTTAFTTLTMKAYALPSEDGITMATNALNQILTYVRIEILLMVYISFEIIGRIYPVLRSIVKGVRK